MRRPPRGPAPARGGLAVTLLAILMLMAGCVTIKPIYVWDGGLSILTVEGPAATLALLRLELPSGMSQGAPSTLGIPLPTPAPGISVTPQIPIIPR